MSQGRRSQPQSGCGPESAFSRVEKEPERHPQHTEGLGLVGVPWGLSLRGLEHRRTVTIKAPRDVAGPRLEEVLGSESGVPLA